MVLLGTTSTASTAGGTTSSLLSIGMLVLMLVVFYFLLIRPQKKRDKETAKMRSELQVADEVVTSGGIIGRVVSIKDDTVLVETGSDKSKIRVARWAIVQNNTVHDDSADAAK